MTTTPPPKPTRLLASVPNKIYSPLVVRYPFQTDREYAAAYHFSAKRLASTFTGNPEDDFLLLPFLTLYRHAFELQLKNTVRGFIGTRMTYVDGRTPELVAAIEEKRIKDDFGHNLYKLLNEAKKHYAALDMPQEFPKELEKLVIMLHDADNQGTAFRYAGQLPEVQEHADFPDLAALLDEQFTMLSVMEDYVDGLYSPSPTLDEISEEYY